MHIDDFEEIGDATPGLPIQATAKNIALARRFVWQKWKERAKEMGRPVPEDLSDSCKFTSQFARIIFGGELQGNVDHQFVRLPNGRILDLNKSAEDVQKKIDHPHIHDPEFFGNPVHEESMASCRGRVLRWVDEFIRMLKTRTTTDAPAAPVIRESEKPGLYVGVKFSPRTVQNLVQWCKDNNIPERTDPSGYHTTVILSPTRKFKYDPMRWDPPLVVTPDLFALDLFGPERNKLVLRYDCAVLEARHWLVRVEEKLPWEYPEYVPHITLSDFEHAFGGTKIDLNDLPVPDFPLQIVAEYVKDFD